MVRGLPRTTGPTPPEVACSTAPWFRCWGPATNWGRGSRVSRRAMGTIRVLRTGLSALLRSRTADASRVPRSPLPTYNSPWFTMRTIRLCPQRRFCGTWPSGPRRQGAIAEPHWPGHEHEGSAATCGSGSADADPQCGRRGCGAAATIALGSLGTPLTPSPARRPASRDRSRARRRPRAAARTTCCAKRTCTTRTSDENTTRPNAQNPAGPQSPRPGSVASRHEAAWMRWYPKRPTRGAPEHGALRAGGSLRIGLPDGGAVLGFGPSLGFRSCVVPVLPMGTGSEGLLLPGSTDTAGSEAPGHLRHWFRNPHPAGGMSLGLHHPGDIHCACQILEQTPSS